MQLTCVFVMLYIFRQLCTLHQIFKLHLRESPPLGVHVNCFRSTAWHPVRNLGALVARKHCINNIIPRAMGIGHNLQKSWASLTCTMARSYGSSAHAQLLSLPRES